MKKNNKLFIIFLSFLLINLILITIFIFFGARIVTLGLKCNNSNEIQFFYVSSDNKEFNELNSSKVIYQPDKELTKIRSFIFTKDISKFRIDFGNKADEYEVAYLSISDGIFSKKVWQGDSFIRDFSDVNQLKIDKTMDGKLNIKTLGNDGFISGNNITGERKFNIGIILIEIILISFLIILFNNIIAERYYEKIMNLKFIQNIQKRFMKLKSWIINNSSISMYSIILLILISMFIFIIERYYPLTPDEFNYSNITWTNQRLSGIKDIIYSGTKLYNNWTGRVFVHGILQSLLFSGKWIYDILDSLIFVGLIYLILKITRNKIQFTNIIIVLAILFLFIPNFGQIVFWMSGSLNYLWPTFAMLLFILNFNKVFIEENKMSALEKTKILLLAALAGICEENVSFLVGSYLFLHLLFNFKDLKEHIYKRLLLGIYSAFAVASGILLFAPGNFTRANGKMHLNFKQLIDNLYIFRYSLVLVSIIILILYIMKQKNKLIMHIKYFILPSFLSLIPMIIIPEFPIRSMFPFSILIFITISDGIITIINQQYKYNFKKLILVICSIITLNFSVPFTWYFLTNVVPYTKQTQDLIVKQKNRNQSNAVINKLQIPQKYEDMVMPGADTDSSSLYNTYFARYYGFSAANAVKPDYSLIELSVDNEGEFDGDYYVYWKDGAGNRISSNTGIVYLEVPLENTNKFKIKFPQNKTIRLKSISIKTIYGIKTYEYNELLNIIKDKNQIQECNLKDGCMEITTMDNTYIEIEI